MASFQPATLPRSWPVATFGFIATLTQGYQFCSNKILNPEADIERRVSTFREPYGPGGVHRRFFDLLF